MIIRIASCLKLDVDASELQMISWRSCILWGAHKALRIEEMSSEQTVCWNQPPKGPLRRRGSLTSIKSTVSTLLVIELGRANDEHFIQEEF